MRDGSNMLVRGLSEFTDQPAINFWLHETLRDNAEGTRLIRARMLIVFVYLMSVFVTPYVFLFAVIDYQPTTLLWLSVVAIPLFLTPGLLKWTGRLDLATHTTCLVTLTITAGNSLTAGGPLPTGIPWMLLAPAYAVIFAGLKEAAFWSAAAVAAALAVFFVVPSPSTSVTGEALSTLQLEIVFGGVGLFLFVTCLFVFQDLLNQSLMDQLVQARERLRRQAIYDDLTDLPNRTLFRDRLRQSVQRARRRDVPIVVGFLDIDEFKEINDTFGHETGDRILTEVGERLGGIIRAEDTVARIGGDEFTFIFERAQSREDVESIFERLQACFSNPIEMGGDEIGVSVSIGFAQFDPDELTELEGDEVAEILRQAADRAMYRAKETQGTDWALSSVDTVFQSENPFRIRRAVRKGVERGEFVPFYQPIVRLDDESMVATEVLMRWEHPTRGIVSPGEFMPVIEGSELIHRVQITMMEQIHREFGKLPRSAAKRLKPIRLLVNLGPDQLANAEILELLEGEHGTEQPDVIRYSFEVTESGLLNAKTSAQRLRAAGFELIVDDFGTGYSSLNRFREFKVDALKIDMEFVQNYELDINRAIVENVADLGRRLDVPVIAEGVETAEQLEFLRAVEGCSFGQGYYFGRPEPFEDFLNRLGERESPTTLFSADSSPTTMPKPETG